MPGNEEKKHGSESKQKILKAALDVVAKHSISGTRMHLIAGEAGMSSANLHYHFETKDELLTDLIQQVQQEFSQRRELCLSHCADTLESHLRAFFWNKKDQILHCPEYDQVEFDYWVTSQSDEKIRKLLQEDFEVWHSDLVRVLRQFCPALSTQSAGLIANIMVSVMKGGALQYLLHNNFDLDAYFELCLSQILYSVDALTGTTGQDTGADAAAPPVTQGI